MEVASAEAGAREERARSLLSQLMAHLAMASRLKPGTGYARTPRESLDGPRWSRSDRDGYRVPRPSDGAIPLAGLRIRQAPPTLIAKTAAITGVEPAPIGFPPVLDPAKSSVRATCSP